MPENTMDKELVRFFPLAELVSVTAEEPRIEAVHRDWYYFAEWSLWAHGFAINVSDARGPVAIFGDRPLHVADSFEDFLHRYIHDPAHINESR